jgi:ParB-like chromosome segregation protein Spo0J
MKIEVKEIENILEVSTDRLKLNPTYYSLVPRPSREEYETLKRDIELNGQLEPIVVNKDFTVLDGHTRLGILKELRIQKAKIIVREFKGKDEELWYVCTSNVKRRHLNTWQRITSTLKAIQQVLKSQGINMPLKDYLQKRGRCGKSAMVAEFRTEGIAKQLGLSARTVRYALYVYFYGTGDLHRELDKGNLSIIRAYNILKKQQTQQTPKVQRPRLYSEKELKEKEVECPYCGRKYCLGDVL